MEELVLDGVQVSKSVAVGGVQSEWSVRPVHVLQLNVVDEFFSATGPKSLIFYYEETSQATKDGK